MLGGKKKILFVINTLAGGNDKTFFVASLPLFAEENAIEYELFYTTGNRDTNELQKRIRDFNPEIITAVGGDGTCNLVGNILVNTDKIMAIIPYGSGNGLASELEIPKNTWEALFTLMHGVIKKIDTITINNIVCLHISDIGLNARIIKRFEEEKIRGIYGYARQFFKELWFSKPSRFIFYYKNIKFRKKAQVIAIANARRYGTGAVINPNGKIDDGKFEVCIVKPYPFWAILTITAAIFLGYLDKIKYADIRSVKKIKIINNKDQPLHIDGEIIKKAKVIEAEINAASLNIIVPKDRIY